VRQLAQLNQYVFSVIEIKSLHNQLSLLLVSAALLLIFTSAAEAHEIKPAIVDLNFKQGTSDTNRRVDGNQLSIDMVVNLESLMADIGPDHKDTDASENSNYYKTLRALDDEALRAEFESFQETLLSQTNVTDSLENTIPLALKAFSFQQSATLISLATPSLPSVPHLLKIPLLSVGNGAHHLAK
jgi:hypothetical protein